jgi:hypothetical protein
MEDQVSAAGVGSNAANTHSTKILLIDDDQASVIGPYEVVR